MSTSKLTQFQPVCRSRALDAEVPLRDAQIVARHADPRTTERYDRARGNLAVLPQLLLTNMMTWDTLVSGRR